jgi:hypothetical protein
VAIWSLDRYSPEGRRAIGLDAAAGVIALALLLLVAVDFSAPLRLVLTLLFTFYVPGRAIVSNWPSVERWSAVGMSIVFSLGVLTLLAMLSLWTGLWHPLALYLFESLASLITITLSLARRYRADGASAVHPDTVASHARQEQAGGHRGAHGLGHSVAVHPAGAGQAETLSWPPKEARYREAPPWRPVENQRTEALSPPAEDERTGTPLWPHAKAPQAQAASQPPAQDRTPTFQPRQPAAAKPAQTPPRPPAEQRMPTFSPRQPAEGTPAEDLQDQPAEDKSPEIQRWQSAEVWDSES